MSEKQREKRKQHWLPASYLQFFAIDPNEQHREGYVFRVSAEGYRSVQIETQGLGKFHYRRQNTHQSEGIFQILESDYPTMVRKAVSGQLLSANEQTKFVLSIVALSCRNPFFINQTGWENWDVFVSISNSFLENHLGALPYENEPQSGLQSISEAIKRAQLINPLPLDGMPSDEEFLRMAHVLHFIGSNFRVAFIENSKGSAPLLTSDFPTLFFTLNQVTVPVMLLPITPSVLAVAYDGRFFDVRHNWLSSEDLQRIQEFLLVQTDRAFFASATPKVELNHLREALQVRLRRSEAWVKPDVWQPVMYSYPKLFEQKGGFGFLLLKE